MAWNNPQWQAWVYNEKVELESKGSVERRPGAKYAAPSGPSKKVHETFLEGCQRHGLDRANSARERRWFRSAPQNDAGHKFFQVGAWRVISPEEGEYRVECNKKLVSRMTCLTAALNTMRSCMEAAS